MNKPFKHAFMEKDASFLQQKGRHCSPANSLPDYPAYPRMIYPSTDKASAPYPGTHLRGPITRVAKPEPHPLARNSFTLYTSHNTFTNTPPDHRSIDKRCVCSLRHSSLLSRVTSTKALFNYN